MAVADNFCPVAIFPSLKRIKEEVVKWLGIVSNEIEIIEIDTDCISIHLLIKEIRKSMK